MARTRRNAVHDVPTRRSATAPAIAFTLRWRADDTKRWQTSTIPAAFQPRPHRRIAVCRTGYAATGRNVILRGSRAAAVSGMRQTEGFMIVNVRDAVVDRLQGVIAGSHGAARHERRDDHDAETRGGLRRGQALVEHGPHDHQILVARAHHRSLSDRCCQRCRDSPVNDHPPRIVNDDPTHQSTITTASHTPTCKRCREPGHRRGYIEQGPRSSERGPLSCSC